MAEYQDKDVDKHINKDLTEQFKEDDRGLYRDDQEIYASAKKVIEKYINEIKNDKTKIHGAWALEEFTKLQKECDTEWTRISKLTGWESWKLCTDNKNLINTLANKIDNAEKIVLERLVMNRATLTAKDIENNKKAGSEFFKTSDKGEIVLTSATNRPKIQEVLETLFKNDPNKKYLIDYSQCTNARIKQNMIASIGTDKCWISYNASSGTYMLKGGPNADPLPIRALVREGVKLIPEAVVSVQAKQELARQFNEKTEKLINKQITNTADGTEGGKLKNLVPKGLQMKLDKLGLMPNFLTQVDKRVSQMIVEAKTSGYTLRQDAVSKLTFSSGLMEAHFMYNNIHTGESAKKDMIVWKDNTDLGKDLYDLLDGNEGDLKSYLEMRFHALRDDFDHLTKRSDLFSDKDETKNPIPEQQEALTTKKENTLYSLTMFQQVLKSLREKEGTSRDDDEKEFNEMIKFVRDAIYSLEKHNPSEEMVKNQIIIPLKAKWMKFMDWNFNGQDGQTRIQKASSAFDKAFSNNKDDIVAGMRDLGQGTTIFGNTHTSFLKEEIAENGDLQLEKAEINDYFQNLKTKLDIVNENDPEFANKKELIDELYEKGSGEKILDLLINKNLVPSAREGNKEVIKECANLKTQLDQRKAQVEQQEQSVTFENFQTGIAEKRLQLEAKPNKTEDELKILQSCLYLEKNTQASKTQFEKSLAAMDDTALYIGIGSMVRTSLVGSFTDLGGGAKGTNADILNDIVGVGFRNLSDENAAKVGPIVTEILITVAVCVLTAGVGGMALQAALRGASALLKFAKAANAAAKVLRFANVGSKVVGGSRLAKLTYTTGSLLLEAPAFNAATNILRNVIDQKELFADMSRSNLNPLAQENIQTAAFLGAMRIFKVPGVLKNTKIGKTAQISFKDAKGRGEVGKVLSAKGVANGSAIASEFATMMAAEQSINLTFGHPKMKEDGTPELDENGEMVMERGFQMPDEAAVAQALGIIIGMRSTARFQIWNGVEQKIAKGEWLIKGRKGSNNIALFDVNTGKEIGLQEAYDLNESQLKSQERQVKAQREKVTEKQKSRDLTNQQITDIKRNQEVVAQKPTESVTTKAEDIANHRESYYENFAKNSHPDIYERYQSYNTENPVNKANALKNLDTELAERLILDNPQTSRISYSTDKARAELSFQKLQKLSKYKNNLELTQLSTGERVISYIKDIGKLHPLESRVKVQERELNDLETELNRRVNTQEKLDIQKKLIEGQKAQLKAESERQEQAFDEFSDKILAPEGIVVGGKKRTMEYIEGKRFLKRDGKITNYAKSDSAGLLPEGAKKIRGKFNSLREQYVRESKTKGNEIVKKSAPKIEKITKEAMENFIRENETLSKSDFMELFGENPGTTTIKQGELGMCYELTANTLLKNAEFFEAFIRTSVKKIDANHFTMEMPFADGKTYTIKVSKAELEKVYEFPDGRKTPAVSDMKLGFQIMELAFMKHSLLMTRDYANPGVKYSKPAMKAIDKFKKTGDFEITSEMLLALEGGKSSLALRDMLGSMTDIDQKPLNLTEINNLPTDSMISVHSGIEGLVKKGVEILKADNGMEYYLIDGIQLQPGHAYALTKRGADFYEITNPHDTSKPIRMTREQFEKAFTEYDVYRPDVGKILSKKTSHEIKENGEAIIKESNKKLDEVAEKPLEEQAKVIEAMQPEVEKNVAEIEKANPATKAKYAKFLYKMGEIIKNGKNKAIGNAKQTWENLGEWRSKQWERVKGYFKGLTPEQETKIFDYFGDKIFSSKGVVVNGEKWKLFYRESMSHNQNRKGDWVFEGPNGYKIVVSGEKGILPDNSGGRRIKAEFERLKAEYIKERKEILLETLLKGPMAPELTSEQIIKVENDNLQQPKLSGSTTSEQVNDLISRAESVKNIFIRGLKDIEKNTNGELKGLEHILKKGKRIEEKVKKEYMGKVENCVDVLRSTLTFETLPDLIKAYDQLPNLLQKYGMSIVRVDNRLKKPRIGEVLINIQMPNGTIAELKLYTEHMYNAQDGKTILPSNTKFLIENEKTRKTEEFNLSNLFTPNEIELVSLLRKNGLTNEGVPLLSDYRNQEINSHTFYEIARCFVDAEIKTEIYKNETLKKLGVDLEMLKNKLEKIQEKNGEYNQQQYEKRTGLKYE